MSLRDAIARAAFEEAAKAKWENATPDDEREFYEIADAVLAALRTELAAHPWSWSELLEVGLTHNQYTSDLRTAARLLRGSSWPGDMAHEMEQVAKRLDDYATKPLDQESQ